MVKEQYVVIGINQRAMFIAFGPYYDEDVAKDTEGMMGTLNPEFDWRMVRISGKRLVRIPAEYR